jgi:predicted dithiol-disulfide oxidoreductase (DUF899 family)
MKQHVTDRESWEAARLELLRKEKALSHAAAELAAARRALPKYRITTPYRFVTTVGEVALPDLFAGRSQLIVQHFMLAPGAVAGCPMCSFWADGYDPMIVHLNRRDISFVAVSRAPIGEIEAYRRRMGWRFPWVSSGESAFNRDFMVYPTEEALAAGRWRYNWQEQPLRSPDMPGISVFEKGQGDEADEVFHTYSTYGRGLDSTNAAYAYIDLTPKGRNEAGLPFPMAWVRRHDEY